MEKLLKNAIRTVINSLPFIAIMVVTMAITSAIVRPTLTSSSNAGTLKADLLAIESGTEQNPTEEIAQVELSDPQPEPIAVNVEEKRPTSPYAGIRETLTEEDIDILIRLVYHESRGVGGEAVIEVVLNRLLDNRFPDTLQGVIFQKNQFEPAPNLYTYEIKEPERFEDCKREVETVLSPDYQRILPANYLFFNNYGAGNNEDYVWIGGNVFFPNWDF